MNRKEAKSLGLTRYFTGLPCKYGHLSERHVANYECVECRKARNVYPPTGYPRGRPKAGEIRPPSPNAIAQAKYKKARLARDPEFRETLNAYFRKAYYKKKEQP